jgi:hypothetical protein
MSQFAVTGQVPIELKAFHSLLTCIIDIDYLFLLFGLQIKISQ